MQMKVEAGVEPAIGDVFIWGKELSFFQTKPCGEIYSLEMGFAVLSEAFFFLESGICNMFGDEKESKGEKKENRSRCQ